MSSRTLYVYRIVDTSDPLSLKDREILCVHKEPIGGTAEQQRALMSMYEQDCHILVVFPSGTPETKSLHALFAMNPLQYELRYSVDGSTLRVEP